MPTYVFPPAPLPAAPVRGRDALFPIHRIFCVGRNYEAHAKEMGATVDREAPFYFTKSAHAYVASGSTVPYPPGTGDYQHEMELVVAIGRAGLRIAESSALEHVYGYACGLDMTRRDLQAVAKEQRRPWDLGKDFDEAAVLSAIVPAAASAPPTAGRIELRVNGAVRQSSDLSLLIHPVPAVIAHLSRYYRLQPGDLIYTGTPEGVGPVVAGDVLEGSIEGVGGISLRVGPAD
jgi:fumarylpyruvate hydrolase